MEPDVIRKRQAHHKTPRHPYAAIEHRVIDSGAYKTLTFSAKAMLVMLARQLTKDNNGHLQATHKYLSGYGFSENTITRSIAELIAHGLVYRSRSGGFHQGAAQYAVTWLPIPKSEGLFLQGFKSCAWREWQPTEENSPPPKMRAISRKNGEWTPPATAKFATSRTPNFEDIELMPDRDVVAAHKRHLKTSIGDVLAPEDSEALERLEVICE